MRCRKALSRRNFLAEMAEVLMAHIASPGRLPRSVTFQPTLVIRESA